jgi:hypothetical protein
VRAVREQLLACEDFACFDDDEVIEGERFCRQ